MKKIIGITMGDPGGIGPEIILKALPRFLKQKRSTVVVFGVEEVFAYAAKKLKLRFKPHFIEALERASLKKGEFYFVNTAERASQVEVGKVSRRNAALAYEALDAATEAANRKEIDALVTAPLNKSAMRQVDKAFVGHTEYLAKRSKVKSFAMMFVGNRLKVTLVTIHIAISKVAKALSTKGILEKISLTHRFLKKHYRLKSPKIAVCALNPHGHETGPEDNRVIKPAVTKARAKKINAQGPLSADQLFYEAYQGNYDAVIAMYHDQGLAPFKMISFEDGVNVTLGLPYIRTSPDHGTAFDIAMKGKAQAKSMISAMTLAERLVV